MDRHRRCLPCWLLPSVILLATAGFACPSMGAPPAAWDQSSERPTVEVLIRRAVDSEVSVRESRLPVAVEPADDPFEAAAAPHDKTAPHGKLAPVEPTPEVPRPTSITARARADEPAALVAESPRPLAEGPSSPLVVDASRTRSESLERIAQEADRQTRRGFELAGRGAYFAARSQFVKALRLAAQGLDTEHGTNRHSSALAAGLTAIDESADFIPTGSRLEADYSVAAIVEGHRTEVLKHVDTTQLSPMLAVKCYFTFAQEQLAVAAGGELAGSMALHAMGKLHAAQALNEADGVEAAESKAVAFYQAALLAYPENHMAANDLGVLLARCGHYGEAEAALRYSLSLNPQATGWHNLTVVYQQLGQEVLRRQTEQLAQSARAAGQSPARDEVRWVDPSAFGQSAVGLVAPGPTAARPATAAPAILGATSQGEPNATTGWLPWNKTEERK